MKKIIKEFKNLLEEKEQVPQDELRDYYLVPIKEIVASNEGIANSIFEDQTPLMMVVKKIVEPNNHSIRVNNLEMLTWNLVETMTPEFLNYQDKDGNNVIHLTCLMDCFSVGILDLMQSCGASFSLVNKKGETPLMMVAASNSLDDLKFIHAYTEKKMINVKDNNGVTALMRAVKSKKINNIFFLLENGADIFVLDNAGLSVVDWLNSKEFQKKSNPKFWADIDNLLHKIIAKKINAAHVSVSGNT